MGADGLTAGMKQRLLEMLEGTPCAGRLVSAEQMIGRLRGRKSPLEQERIREAVRITESIFDELDAFLRVGQTEIEIQRVVHRRMAELGVGFAWQAEANPAVDAGPNKRFGHGAPSENRTKAGHLLHFDFGVQAAGYSADLQRMYFFGPPGEIPDEVLHAFDTVRDAIDLADEVLRPGVRGKDVDAVARRHVTVAAIRSSRTPLGIRSVDSPTTAGRCSAHRGSGMALRRTESSRKATCSRWSFTYPTHPTGR